MPAHDRSHYRGGYQAQAKRVRQAAYANPATRCWVCNRTLAEHARKWTAGHVIDGQAGGVLLAECEQCNLSRGAAMGNRKRIEPREPWP